MDSAISFTELLSYTEQENRRWKEWFQAHPAALEVPCDIAKVGDVRRLFLHIIVSQLFFGYRVLDLPVPDWKPWVARPLSVDELFEIGEDACRKLRQFIAQAEASDWDVVKDLGFHDLKVSKRKMVAQALLHGVHHRGQLAVLLRQQGFDGLWEHDLILTDVMK